MTVDVQLTTTMQAGKMCIVYSTIFALALVSTVQGDREIICPLDVRSFSAAPRSIQYYACDEEGQPASLRSCPANQVYWASQGRCAGVGGGSTRSLDEGGGTDIKSERMPVLGRVVFLGDLYDARRDEVLPGMSLWGTDIIEAAKRRNVLQSSTVDIVSAESIKAKTNKMDISASLKMSFMSGLVAVEGSAAYLKDSAENHKDVSVMLKYSATTHSETMPAHIPLENEDLCDAAEASKGPTHVVSSLIYGLDANFIFKKEVDCTSSKDTVAGSLSIAIKAIPGFQVSGNASVNISSGTKDLTKNIDIKLFGDFVLDKQPSTYQQTIDIYQRLTTFLGEAPEYSKAAKTKMQITPISRYCPSKEANILLNLGQEIVNQISDMLSELATTKARAESFASSDVGQQFVPVTRILQNYLGKLTAFELSVKAQLQKLLPQIRGGNDKTAAEDKLLLLKQNYTSSDFELAKSRAWLNKRQREISIIKYIIDPKNYEEAPNIKVENYEEANDIKEIYAKPEVVVLQVNILPDADTEMASPTEKPFPWHEVKAPEPAEAPATTETPRSAQRVVLSAEKAQAERQKHSKTKKVKAVSKQAKADSKQVKAESKQEKAESKQEKAVSKQAKADSKQVKAASKQVQAESKLVKAESKRIDVDRKVRSKREEPKKEPEGPWYDVASKIAELGRKFNIFKKFAEANQDSTHGFVVKIGSKGAPSDADFTFTAYQNSVAFAKPSSSTPNGFSCPEKPKNVKESISKYTNTLVKFELDKPVGDVEKIEITYQKVVGTRGDDNKALTKTKDIKSEAGPKIVMTVEHLVPNTDYTFHVRFLTNAGGSPQSDEVKIRTRPSSAPQNLRTEAVAGETENYAKKRLFKWDRPSESLEGTIEYNVLVEGVSSRALEYSFVKKTTATELEIPRLGPGNQYKFSVETVLDIEMGTPEKPVTLQTRGTRGEINFITSPASPSSPLVEYAETFATVSVEWTTPEDIPSGTSVDSYTCFLIETNYERVHSVGDALKCTFAGLEANKRYQAKIKIKVTGSDIEKDSEYSDPFPFRTIGEDFTERMVQSLNQKVTEEIAQKYKTVTDVASSALSTHREGLERLQTRIDTVRETSGETRRDITEKKTYVDVFSTMRNNGKETLYQTSSATKEEISGKVEAFKAEMSEEITETVTRRNEVIAPIKNKIEATPNYFIAGIGKGPVGHQLYSRISEFDRPMAYFTLEECMDSCYVNHMKDPRAGKQLTHEVKASDDKGRCWCTAAGEPAKHTVDNTVSAFAFAHYTLFTERSTL